MRSERLDLIVTTPGPAAAVAREPIGRPLGARALAPRPAVGSPEFPGAISVGIDESRELVIGHWRLGDTEWRDGDLVPPFLVVEDKAVRGRRAELPASARHVHVAGPGPGAAQRGPATLRSRIAERLSRIGQRLDVHVLVPDRELVEIARGAIDSPTQPIELTPEDVPHVSE